MKMRSETLLIRLVIVVLLIICYGSFLWVKIDFLTLSVHDLGRHIQNGNVLLHTRDVLVTNYYSYTRASYPFINHHWLSGVLFFGIVQYTGFVGLTVMKIMVLIAAFLLVYGVAVKKTNFWIASVVSIPVLLILKERIAVRPEIFSYLFTAMYVYILADFPRSMKTKLLFWLIPLQVLWVNMHSFFFIGVLLVVGLLCEMVLLHWREKNYHHEIRTLIFVFIGVMVASFVNPNGVQGMLYPFLIFKNYSFAISENQRLFTITDPWLNISFVTFIFMAVLSFFCWIYLLRQRMVFYLLLSVGTLVASVFLIRSLPLFALTSLLVVSVCLWGMTRGMVVRFRNIRTGVVTALLVLLMGIPIGVHLVEAAVGPVLESGIGIAADANAAADFFQTQHLHGPIFNDYDIGSYLIYYLSPQEKVFVDNRPEAYPASFFTDVYVPMIQQESEWKRREAQYGFQTIFFSQRDMLPGAGQFLMRRIQDLEWALVYADAYAVILVKRTRENRELIRQFGLTSETIGSAMKNLVISSRLTDRLGAANIFLLMGQPERTLSVYRGITRDWPLYMRGRSIQTILEKALGE